MIFTMSLMICHKRDADSFGIRMMKLPLLREDDDDTFVVRMMKR